MSDKETSPRGNGMFGPRMTTLGESGASLFRYAGSFGAEGSSLSC